MSSIPASETLRRASPDQSLKHRVLRLTPPQWRAILESRAFLERDDNRFQHPRRFLGAFVQIIPDESFR
jgi:hypothetical protein